MSEWDAATAEWYAEKYGEYPTNRLAVDLIELVPDATVVDVGCGAGSALRHAAGRVVRGRLIGVDPVPRMLEIARERLAGHAAAGRIEFRAGSADALPVDDHVADVVLALDSFDHWGHARAQGLAEVRRILAPGGRFVMVKDADAPSAASPSSVGSALAAAGFSAAEERFVEGEGVRFTLWVCGVEAGPERRGGRST